MISRNLFLRLLIAVVFIPLMIIIFRCGGIPFLVLVEILIAVSLWEFFTLTRVKLYLPQKLLLIVLACYPAIAYNYFDQVYIVEMIICVLFLSSLPHVFSAKLGALSRSIGLTFWGVCYLSLGYNSLILIRNGDLVENHLAGNWIIFLFATIWIADTAAYYFGWRFGRSKLSPLISPNKTVIGFICGFGGALISAAIFNFLFLSEVGFFRLIAPALIIACFGQLGDLVESIFKREMGQKDSSSLIPGHGGALDRFDSLLFAAPALYFYLQFIK